MAFDRNRCREACADASPEVNANTLAELLDVCGELARELHLPLPDLIRGITIAYTEAHDLEVTHFECEPDDEAPNEFATIVATTPKWRKN